MMRTIQLNLDSVSARSPGADAATASLTPACPRAVAAPLSDLGSRETENQVVTSPDDGSSARPTRSPHLGPENDAALISESAALNPPDYRGQLPASPLSRHSSGKCGEAGPSLRLCKSRLAMLRKLIAHAGEVVPHHELNVCNQSLRVIIRKIRKLLPEETQILSVHGEGYLILPAHAEILRNMIDGDK